MFVVYVGVGEMDLKFGVREVDFFKYMIFKICMVGYILIKM